MFPRLEIQPKITYIFFLYFQANPTPFRVESGSLGFSVTLYTATAILSVILLMLRRVLPIFGNAELGGNVAAKYVSSVFLVCLWFTYVILSSLQAYGHITAPF